MLTHISFDRAGVAAEYDLEAAIREAQKRWPAFTEEIFRAILKTRIGERNYKREFQEGRIDTETYLNAALNIGNIPNTPDNRAFLYHVHTLYYTKPFYPIVDMNRQLQDQGIYTSVLSNASVLSWYAEGSLINEVVDCAVASFEIGVTKPNRRAYEILLERIGATDPSTVLFVDDHKKNV
ncbi:MAG: HAD family hydrolase, partial [Nanoarchaeota archaeon]